MADSMHTTSGQVGDITWLEAMGMRMQSASMDRGQAFCLNMAYAVLFHYH